MRISWCFGGNYASNTNSTNFAYKVAYWYDGMETTNKRQVFRENHFARIFGILRHHWSYIIRGVVTSTERKYTLPWISRHLPYRCYKFRCTLNIDYGENRSRWMLRWRPQLNFRLLYIIWRRLFRSERSVPLRMVSAITTRRRRWSL